MQYEPINTKNGIMEFEPTLYIIMRTDIPQMNPGKLGAQAAHAQADFNAYVGSMPGDTFESFHKTYGKWCENRSFGRTIVLAGTRKEIITLCNDVDVSGITHDPTYPIINALGNMYTERKDTCGWFFPTTRLEMETIKNSGLELYP